MWRKTLLACAMLLGTGTAFADPTEVGGTLYAETGATLASEDGLQPRVDVTRMYLTATRKVSDSVKVRVTTDAGRDPDMAKIRVFIKLAYMEWETPLPNIKLQVGCAATPYTGMYDSFFGHRFVWRPFADISKVLYTADIGVHALGTGLDKHFSWQVSLVNGNGFASATAIGPFSAQARATLDYGVSDDVQVPLTGFISYDLAPTDEPVLVAAGALGVKTPYALMWMEVLSKGQGDQDGMGYSATLMPRHPKLGALFARYDHWDPNAEVSDDATTRIIAGVSRKLQEKVNLALDYERTQKPEGLGQGVYMKLEAGF